MTLVKEVIGISMIKNMLHKYTCLVLLLVFFSCSNNEVRKNDSNIQQIEVPIFNSDSAYSYIEKQVSFGPRFLSSKGWSLCSEYLEEKLRLYTPNVIIQRAPVTTYDGKDHVLRNIIASFSPEKNNRIVFFAHWDTRHVADYDTLNTNQPILGANDGGSGVGVLLEVARQLSLKSPRVGVDIIFFDAEDYGQPENSGYPIVQDSWCLGSQYWAANLHTKDYFPSFGILLDMVGAKDAVFTHEEVSSYYADHVLNKVWKVAHRLGFGKHFIFQKTRQILDDHYYVNTIAAIPTIDIIEYDPTTETNFNKHWHTHGDDMNNINKETLYAVGQTVLQVIYQE